MGFAFCGGLLRQHPARSEGSSSLARFAAKIGDHRQPVVKPIVLRFKPMKIDCRQTLGLRHERGYDTQQATVTRRKVAGIEVAPFCGLWFWLANRSSSSFCSSSARPFFSAAANAFMVGP